MFGRLLTKHERALQVSATDALKLADAHRKDRAEFDLWITAAASANERTRLSLIERGVAMFTRTTRSVNK